MVSTDENGVGLYVVMECVRCSIQEKYKCSSIYLKLHHVNKSTCLTLPATRHRQAGATDALWNENGK
ncbi:MAG: hypothetical protein IPN36_02540 [Bacteroidetes bacterium]|nr:hypothetical protein [Bacteroidota bacterium]